uniref:Glycosyltransferase family 25 LPS biosynthesis protein n=1 Tax=Pithovirus LCPAC104 TaxID=2506589 RepID=A0A481Z5Y2_9VIRU|nr:MAG: glycosyltransferase family 25 LPS biosynthesis protein [Pithovirus LCPAC104]
MIIVRVYGILEEFYINEFLKRKIKIISCNEENDEENIEYNLILGNTSRDYNETKTIYIQTNFSSLNGNFLYSHIFSKGLFNIPIIDFFSDILLEKKSIISSVIYSEKDNFIKSLKIPGIEIDFFDVKDKEKALKNYKYTIAFEENYLNYYLSEKIINPIISETLCFYYGCPNLEKYIDSNSFIRIDKENYAEVIENSIKNNFWGKNIDTIREMKKKYINKLSLVPIVEKIIYNIRFPIYIINLDRRKDRWRKISKKLTNKWDNINKFSAINGKDLVINYQKFKIFEGNDFNNRRTFIACALSHIELWKKLISENSINYYIIFEDDILLSKKFSEKILSLCRTIEYTKKIDLIFLGLSFWRNKREESFHNIESNDYKIKKFDNHKKLNSCIGGMFGYIISKNCAKMLLEIIEKEGIKNGIDYWLLKQLLKINSYVVEPHFVYTEYSHKDMKVDSDIQEDHEEITIENFQKIEEVFNDNEIKKIKTKIGEKKVSVINKEYICIYDYDSYFNDINHYENKDIFELIDLCIEKNAIGFNTNGWLKEKISESNEWIEFPNGKLIIKKSFFLN